MLIEYQEANGNAKIFPHTHKKYLIYVTKIAETRAVLKEGGEPGERTALGVAVDKEPFV